MVGGSGDLGADVIARAPDGRRIVLQAKRYRNGRSVGSQDVQRFGGTAHTIHGADVAAVVTTAHAFTPQAGAYAAKAGILLVPAKALAAWESPGQPPGTKLERPASIKRCLVLQHRGRFGYLLDGAECDQLLAIGASSSVSVYLFEPTGSSGLALSIKYLLLR
ncbi:restriction endonuclease [Nocardia amikacinitolerans]|uniref:restriction endonuclease n=1 Tax=Nocardia amikacinitolerans TaxID=756689 RepID=UPI00369D5239